MLVFQKIIKQMTERLCEESLEIYGIFNLSLQMGLIWMQ